MGALTNTLETRGAAITNCALRETFVLSCFFCRSAQRNQVGVIRGLSIANQKARRILGTCVPLVYASVSEHGLPHIYVDFSQPKHRFEHNHNSVGQASEDLL